MTETRNPKRYDLEDRTLEFAKRVRALVKKLGKTLANIEDGKQLIKSSGSVGANYIEAKESGYWLKLIDRQGDLELGNERGNLEQEVMELTNIFGSILRKEVLQSTKLRKYNLLCPRLE